MKFGSSLNDIPELIFGSALTEFKSNMYFIKVQYLNELTFDRARKVTQMFNPSTGWL